MQYKVNQLRVQLQSGYGDRSDCQQTIQCGQMWGNVVYNDDNQVTDRKGYVCAVVFKPIRFLEMKQIRKIGEVLTGGEKLGVCVCFEK